MFTGFVFLLIVVVVSCLVSYLSGGKEKDYNKFMGNFRN